MVFLLMAYAENPRLIPVLARSAWNAKPPKVGCISHQISKITIHHTATLSKDNSKTPKRMYRYQSYHQSKGWIDIAYHYLIDQEGNVYEGRRTSCAGDTGTNYDPTGHLLIVLEGNFEAQKPTEKAKKSLVRLMTYGSANYRVPIEEIHGHRDVAATQCPGQSLFAELEELKRQALVFQTEKQIFQLQLLSAEEGKRRVREIEQK